MVGTHCTPRMLLQRMDNVHIYCVDFYLLSSDKIEHVGVCELPDRESNVRLANQRNDDAGQEKFREQEGHQVRAEREIHERCDEIWDRRGCFVVRQVQAAGATPVQMLGKEDQ